MPTTISPPTTAETVADLLEQLGHIPPERVRLRPAPGTATEADVIALAESVNKRLCELIDGVLVEKAVGFRESFLGAYLIHVLESFVLPRNLGMILGEQGMMRLFPGRVRIPDVAFVPWDRLPGRRVPTAPIPDVAPDLAVEVLSLSNTAAEMSRKRDDYFAAGARLVWEIDPVARTVAVYTSAATPDAVLTAADTLTAGPVLPGFTLPLTDLFAELDRHG